MIEPTAFFEPFGKEGPAILLFGDRTGDWSTSNLQQDHLSNPGLYKRLSQVTDAPSLYIPSLIEHNALISRHTDFGQRIQNGTDIAIYRGVRSDGLTLPVGRTAAAFATADCPTIVVHCSTTQRTIVAHAGVKSLVDVDRVLNNKPARKYPSVVDAITEKIRSNCLLRPQVFVVCGIKRYNWSALYSHLYRTEVGFRAAQHGAIDLKVLIADQFAVYGIRTIMTDTIDTFGDTTKVNHETYYKWHSYRRDKTATRNLVLVINR